MKRYLVILINKLLIALKLGRVKQKQNRYWGSLTKTEIRSLFIYEKFLETKDIPGDIVECGVGTGGSIIFLKSLQREKKDNRKMWGFDSFEGFPKGSDKDSEAFRVSGRPSYEKYSTLDYVLNNCKKSGLSNDEIDSIKFIKGWIPDSFYNYDNSSISLLNVDVDLYQSTKDCLNKFWQLMSPGGIVMLDEYNFSNDALKWPGAKIAVDEFCEENSIEVIIHYTGKAYLQKK